MAGGRLCFTAKLPLPGGRPPAQQPWVGTSRTSWRHDVVVYTWVLPLPGFVTWGPELSLCVLGGQHQSVKGLGLIRSTVPS